MQKRDLSLREYDDVSLRGKDLSENYKERNLVVRSPSLAVVLK